MEFSMPKSSLSVKINKIREDRESISDDNVAVEEPLEIQICSNTLNLTAAKSVAITMRTPGHDFDLALGFLYTESIIKHMDDIVSINHVGNLDNDAEYSNTVRVELKPTANIDLERLKRHFYTTSSCGVCGKVSIEALENIGLTPIKSDFQIKKSELVKIPIKLEKEQKIFGKTGGLHAAAAFNENGEIILVREDIGRHNALDKIIGALLKNNQSTVNNTAFMVSGRTSFELVQKSIAYGAPLLAAVSAPSSLAIQLSKEFDMTLIGFLRKGNFNIYNKSERIVS